MSERIHHSVCPRFHIDESSDTYRELERIHQTSGNHRRRLDLLWPDGSHGTTWAFGQRIGSCRDMAEYTASLWQQLGAKITANVEER
jgi:hypothetical protein